MTGDATFEAKLFRTAIGTAVIAAAALVTAAVAVGRHYGKR